MDVCRMDLSLIRKTGDSYGVGAVDFGMVAINRVLLWEPYYSATSLHNNDMGRNEEANPSHNMASCLLRESYLFRPSTL